jgi:carboxyl-terminal processing protease
VNKQPQDINNSPSVVRMPILIAMLLAGGILIGATFFGGRSKIANIQKTYTKYREILTLIESSYVDSVDTDSLVDYSIKKMLEKLDPHTAYFPSDEAVAARSSLESGFDGIGVEFNLYRDTVYVVSAMPGGPSELVGIKSGDALVKVDGTSLVGPKVENSQIFSKLRGKRGTKVSILVKRKGQAELLSFTVTRDRIPSFSVSASYMLDNQTGYMKVDRFSESTFDEFHTQIAELKNQGMKRFVLDLRGNPGGYKDRAERMVDELVAGEKLVVYTDGKGTQYDTRTYTRKDGLFESGAVVVLVDENSASASEIVAGALQDNDRALIVGRRSFGKGLVQMPVTLSDGSELRLTISRYFTPSGRCIQKHYSLGEDDEYDKDYEKRVKSGELFKADSIKNDAKLKFQTAGGRTVYGGGGITPDVFVPKDTTHLSAYLYDLWGKNIIREYALDYANDHRATFEKQAFKDFNKTFAISETMFADLNKMAKESGVKMKEADVTRSKSYIKAQIKAYIARNVWFKRNTQNGLNNEYFQVMSNSDDILQAALNHFNDAEKMARGELSGK